jgi:peptidoglycan/xylan/chitin deacetylase (PgdA/CDA1 family)
MLSTEHVTMNGIVILTFHGIGEPSRRLYPDENRVWLSERAFLSILDVVRDRPDLRITFDDGNASDAVVAMPALIERELVAEFYIVAGRLGAPGYLSAEQLHILSRTGMKIGSHGMMHRPWRDLTDRALDEEIVEARNVLNKVVGARIDQAACPFGAYDRRVLGHLRRMGYTRVYSSDGGRAQSAAWLQPRNTVRSHDNASTIERLIDEPQPFSGVIARKTKVFLKRLR